jgi:hypothetical protein
MEKLKRDIRLYFSIHNHRPVQDAGGKKKKRQEITYNGHKIYYLEVQNPWDDKDTVFYYGGRDAGRRPCFILSIIGKKGALQSLERGEDCFVDKHGSTKDLVTVAFLLAKEKGCTEFELTDNSSIKCPPYSFSLSDVYFLTHGQTWYESILKIKPKTNTEEDLSKYRKQVETNKWSTIADYLIKNEVDLNFISIKAIKDIDINKPGSAMAVLNKIKDLKNDISCIFFAKYTEKILLASGIPSMRGKSWKYEE